MEPRIQLPVALSAVRARFGRLHLSRVLETEPYEVDDPRLFLNVAIAFEASVEASELKSWFNQLEQSQGRDRDDPLSSRKARPLDLDILFALEPGRSDLPVALVPGEPYARPFVLDLAAHLGLACDLSAPPLPAGIALRLDGVTVGERPMTVEPEGGR